MKRKSSWLANKLQFLVQFKLTPAGRLAVFLMFLSAIGIITTEIPIYQVFCGIIALFGVGEFIGVLMRPKLRVSGSLPEKIIAGESTLGLLTVENRGIFPALDIACGCFVLPRGIRHLSPETTVRMIRRNRDAVLPVLLQVDRRGEYLLSEIYVHSTFPLNIMRTGAVRLPPLKLTVVPSFHPLEEMDIPISHRYQHGGILLDSRSGNAAEYIGNRDYIPGEPTKRLDFRAWARWGKPVVREYQDEFCSRVAVVMDSYTSKAPIHRRKLATQELEAAISLTASVVDALEKKGTSLELFAVGPDVYNFNPADSGQSYLDTILEILASTERSKTNPFEKVTTSIAESLESISVVVCILVDWDEWREELVNQILQSGCSVRVLLVRSRPPTHPFPAEEFYSQFTTEQVLGGDVCLL